MTEQTGGSNRDMFGASGFGDTSGFGGLAVREQQLVSSPKPYGGWFDEATTALEHAFPQFGDAIERVVVHRGELTLFVKRESLPQLLQTLRDDPRLRFEHFSGVSGVDYPNDPTGHDHQVGLARRRGEPLHAEARDVEARAADRHHLDRAAGESELRRPDRVLASEVEELCNCRQQHALRKLLLESHRISPTPGRLYATHRRR